MSIIVIQKLTKRYGRRVGIHELDLAIPEGSIFGFLGPNGAGKTTTIRVLLGLLRPSGGGARIFGLDCWRASHRIKADVGYAPGDLRLYPWLTGRKALRIFGRVRHRDLDRHGGELAEMFDLDPCVPVRKMSRGMRQKLGLVLALAHKPRLLILDEPTSGLDPLMQLRLNEHLRHLVSGGHTVFFSSHTLGEVERLCDRVAILREGKLIADDSLEALRRKARRQVTLRWQRGTDIDTLDPPPFLDVLERRRREWRCALTGNVMELVRWCADRPLEDFSVGEPDLQSLFRQFYQ